MSEINTGGPAFPPSNPGYAHGMTLRDYFAAKALPSAIESWKNQDALEPDGGFFVWMSYKSDDDCFPAAELAYRMADAMLEARKEGGAA